MDLTGENDWDNLVDEMEKIRGRVEQALDSPEVPETSTAQQEYASMDEMLSGLGREEIEADLGKGLAGGESSVPMAKVVPFEAPQSAPSRAEAGAPTESALSLAVVGALKLRLELTREAQTVQIHLEEAQLRVELSDGTQFRIPLNKAA